MIDSHDYDILSREATDRESMAWYISCYIENISIRNYSQTTVATRRRLLKRFMEWCHDRGLIRPAEITKHILQRYQRTLFRYRRKNGKPLAFSSQHIHLLALKGFFKWLSRSNFILYNPAADLEYPKINKRLPRHILTIEEVEGTLNQPDLTTCHGIRDRAMMETMYSTGIRRAEVVNLKIYDVNMNAETLFIHCGKGGKDRVVPLGERAMKWISKYLLDIRPDMLVNATEETLFLNKFGEKMSPDYLAGAVRKYMVAAGVTKPGACHLFRHTMATLMLENGADIRYIQHILGHVCLDTTQLYTHVSILKLKEIHKATHPAGRVREDKREMSSNP